jgi:hypothetical protein
MGALITVLGLSLLSAFLTISIGIGKGRTTVIHFSTKPAIVAVRKQGSGRDSGMDYGIENTSLRKLVEDRCKSLFMDFRPLWYLFKYAKNYFSRLCPYR